MAVETVTLATIRQNVFATIFTIVDDNKPSGWTVLSAYPEDNAIFPCIVINPALIKVSIIGLDASCLVVEDIGVEFEFYALSKDNKDKIDQGRDNVQTTLLDKTSTLSDNNLVLNEDPFDDSNTDSFLSGDEKINTGASIASFSKK